MTPGVLIVDDEGPARTRLVDLLADVQAQFPHRLMGEARNGREAIEAVNRGGVDIVLLDIRMPVMDGIEAAQHLVKLESPPALIFITAYDQYAVKAFELNAVDYLMKPIRAERLVAALAKTRRPLGAARTEALSQAFAAASSRARKHLSAHERGRITLIPIDDVLYLRAELKYVTVRTAQREHLLEDSLTKLEEEYGERFIRIHRNCLVARTAIAGFERNPSDEEHGWHVLIRGTGEKLSVSRRQAHLVREYRH
jgi:two-component system response regulator AlgR